MHGEDAERFLQGQFTNDLRGLAGEPAGARYGLWLTLKGKVLADSFVLSGQGNEFWIGSYFCPAGVIRDRLESHVIADDVTIEDVTADYEGVTLLGLTPALPAGLPGAARWFRGRRTRGPHFECVYPTRDGMPASVKSTAATTVDADTMMRLRIADAISAVPVDVGPADLPNEAGLETDAISYTKGCYLGQEVMARLKSMGQVRRRLVRVEGTGAPPATPAPVFTAARQGGEVRSAVALGAGKWIGLAMISRVHVPAGGPRLALSANGEPSVQVTESP